MELTILGSGTCVPSAERGSPANFLEIGKTKILVDCGPGTLRQMKRAGLNYKDLDYVFLTHFHSDHVADLIPLLQALNWTPRFDRKKQLTIAGPNGLLTFYGKLEQLFPGVHPRIGTYDIDIVPILTPSYGATREFRINTAKTIHNEESIAYRFEAEGKSVAISGDCEYSENLSGFFKNADILVLECSFLEKIRGHLAALECGEIACAARVKKLVLTHLYPPTSGKARLEAAKRHFPNTVLAHDLMRIRI